MQWKVKGKNPIRIKSCNPSQNFWEFSEKFYNSSFPENCPYSELFWTVFSRIRTRITQNMDSFHAVGISAIFIIRISVLQLHRYFYVQQRHSVVLVCYYQWQLFFEFGLFYVHWACDVCSLTDEIDCSHTTKE